MIILGIIHVSCCYFISFVFLGKHSMVLDQKMNIIFRALQKPFGCLNYKKAYFFYVFFLYTGIYYSFMISKQKLFLDY